MILRHTERSAYRCFLPDLAGFTGFCCTGPGPEECVIRQGQPGNADGTRLRSPSHRHRPRLTRHTFNMAERVGIRSRACALPLRGPAPSCLPTQGSVSPAIPLVRIPPHQFTMAIRLAHFANLTCTSGWRRGWDSNPRSLSGQRFSRPSDSAALAPLRARPGKDPQLTVDVCEIQMKS